LQAAASVVYRTPSHVIISTAHILLFHNLSNTTAVCLSLKLRHAALQASPFTLMYETLRHAYSSYPVSHHLMEMLDLEIDGRKASSELSPCHHGTVGCFIPNATSLPLRRMHNYSRQLISNNSMGCLSRS